MVSFFDMEVYAMFPTGMELHPFAELLEGRSGINTGMRPGYRGKVRGHLVTAVLSGVGQANTAQAMTALLEDRPADMVILGGCAGLYMGASRAAGGGGPLVGDLAVATEEVYADLGVITHGGWKGMEETGLPLVLTPDGPSYGRFPLTSRYAEKVLPAADAAVFERPNNSRRPPRVHFGRFLTVSNVSGTAERGDMLYGRFRALCENMEGAAAAQVAALYGTPFLEFRGISNMVEDRDRSGWDIKTASINCARLILNFLASVK